MANSHQTSDAPADVATRFCKHVADRRLDLVSDMFSQEAQWWVVANTKRADWGGSFKAKTRAERAGGFLADFEQWSFSVLSLTAQENRVVVEGLGKGRGPGVVQYGNNYLMKFTIENGLIVDLKEFMDSYEVEELFKSKEAQAKAS